MEKTTTPEVYLQLPDESGRDALRAGLLALQCIPVNLPDSGPTLAQQVARCSIIVPMLNEVEVVPGLLARLAPLVRQGCEVLIVDGGSEDDSVALATQAGIPVVVAPRGRARQMNAGAARASGDVLLFLHADTRLPENAVTLVQQALLENGPCWGRFDVRIEAADPVLRVVACMMNLRSRWSGIATGDQALFVKRSAFDAVGGYPDQPLMEDIEMSRRLKRLWPPVCLRAKATTSGRRWETRGVWRTIFLMWRLRWAYWRGVPASELARAYQ